MASVLLLSCFLLAVVGVICVQSEKHTVQRDAQQLTEEPLREKKSTYKSKEGLGTVVAQLVSELSTLKVKQETDLQSIKSELQSTKSELQSTKSELQSTKSDLQSTKSKLQSTKSELFASQAKMTTQGEQLSLLTSTVKKIPGSSFVRWGRKSCPYNTILVYQGIAGGKYFEYKGGGTNRLCLTKTPQFDSTPKPLFYGLLYGAEYEHIPGHHDRDVPCSVCLAPQSTTIMVPATLTCPPGWTPQYNGHLASEHSNHHGGEYVCLDDSPEDAARGTKNDNGLMFYYVVTVCGSLPCPPYIDGKVVTCVVCSK